MATKVAATYHVRPSDYAAVLVSAGVLKDVLEKCCSYGKGSRIAYFKVQHALNLIGLTVLLGTKTCAPTFSRTGCCPPLMQRVSVNSGHTAIVKV